MEELASSGDSDTDSDELSKEVEDELYSVLHHNDFSQGIPPELLEKYSISTNANNEFVISYKRSTDITPSVVKQETRTNYCDLSSSSNDDVVVLDSDESVSIVNPYQSKKERVERVIEECSDNSVDIIEMPKKRKHSVGSQSSHGSIINLTSDDDNFDFSINTTSELFYESDGNVSDVVGKKAYKWEDVASPSTWTKEMRKYYNRPCDKLRYFDHKQIRQQIKTGTARDWYVSPRDLFPDNRPRRRCDICRQTDHIARNCPKQNPTCHMCGTEGHSNIDCPNSICLQCGRRSNQFTSTCRSCSYMLNRECFNCKQTGHESRSCPEKWRDFHSTVERPLRKMERRSQNVSLQCCNCGDMGHPYEGCNQQYLSSSTKSLPAYAWLHGRSGGSNDWRYSGFGGFVRGNFGPPHKRQKFSHNGSFRGHRSQDGLSPDPSREEPWYLQHCHKTRLKKNPKRRKKERMMKQINK